MKKNKFKLALLALVSVITLGACSADQDIATMKGGKITVTDFYDEIKTDPNTQGNLRNMIIYKIADLNYGDKVDKKKVDTQVDDLKEQLGENFESQLEMMGMTEASYREAITQDLTLQAMLKAHIKVEEEDLKAAWANYHPEVEAQLMAFNEKEDAEAALKKVTDKPADFGKIAKDESADPSAKDEGKVKFDSTDTEIPQEVKEKAYDLKNDDVSEISEVSTATQEGEVSQFFIVKMIKNKEKGNDFKPYEKELKEIVEEEKLMDQEFQAEVIKDELRKANVKIKDDAMKGALAGYLDEEEDEEEEEGQGQEEEGQGQEEAEQTEATEE